MYGSVNYIYRVVRHIPSTYVSYSWEFAPFYHFYPIPLPPPLPLVTTNLMVATLLMKRCIIFHFFCA